MLFAAAADVPTLWQSQCEFQCPVFGECGGAPTAPCECIWVGSAQPGRAHRCESCNHFCRDRRGDAAFEEHAQDGLPLADLVPSPCEGNALELPLFVPAHTRELGRRLSLSWVAADLRDLFSEHRRGPVTPRRALKSACRLRRALRVSDKTNVLAVLNGRDDTLQGFWESNRTDAYNAFRRCGVSAVTGPTYSVFTETPQLLASHNVIMMMRHHRVVSELWSEQLVAIPNIYWRDKRDLQRWVEWLNHNRTVHTICRDFSMTKQPEGFEPHLNGLISIIERVERPLHVVVLGVGLGKAVGAIARLRAVRATCTIVSSEPVLRAIKRGELITPGRRLYRPRSRSVELPLKRLAAINIRRFERHLLAASDKLTA